MAAGTPTFNGNRVLAAATGSPTSSMFQAMCIVQLIGSLSLLNNLSQSDSEFFIAHCFCGGWRLGYDSILS
ncbi:hypothetical protein L2E82_10157 [Cichorium intybus]|uniref:Uncharacterized protein n=1 Tax=Cichorium intybus TaxID=13427 RepID=A0ACB9GAE0_CICIN|nr:hypothetical protein L2E82_10157 [Cichorium intybus]